MSLLSIVRKWLGKKFSFSVPHAKKIEETRANNQNLIRITRKTHDITIYWCTHKTYVFFYADYTHILLIVKI